MDLQKAGGDANSSKCISLFSYPFGLLLFLISLQGTARLGPARFVQGLSFAVMLHSLVTAALLGVSATLAAPWSKSPTPMNSLSHGSNETSSVSNLHGGYPSGHGQVPFKFPLPNGFPNIKNPSAALTHIVRMHSPLDKTED